MDNNGFVVLYIILLTLTVVILLANIAEIKAEKKAILRFMHALTNVNSPVKANEVILYYAYMYKLAMRRMDMVERAFNVYRSDIFIKNVGTEQFKNLNEVYEFYHKAKTIQYNPNHEPVEYIKIKDIHEQAARFEKLLAECKSYLQ